MSRRKALKCFIFMAMWRQVCGLSAPKVMQRASAGHVIMCPEGLGALLLVSEVFAKTGCQNGTSPGAQNA